MNPKCCKEHLNYKVPIQYATIRLNQNGPEVLSARIPENLDKKNLNKLNQESVKI